MAARIWPLQLLFTAAAVAAVAGEDTRSARRDSPLAPFRTQPVESLVPQLASPVAAARALVACALRERRAAAAPAITGLVALLDDASPVDPAACGEQPWRWTHEWDREPTTPGQEAARALAAIGIAAFEPVVAVVASGGDHARRNATWALGALQDARAVPALVGRLRDASGAVREQAAWALGAIQDARAVDPLARDALADAEPRVRRQAAWALGAIQDARAGEPLIRALRDADHAVRRQAAWALGAVQDRRAVPGLLGALKDTQHDVREQAAWALGAIQDRSAVPGLVDALKDAQPDVRAQAAWALGAIGDGTAADGLTAALQDSSAKVRRQAAWALGVVSRR